MDAARVDGCGELRILTTVVLAPREAAIAAVALFSFLYTFNDFFLPLLYSGEAPDHWVLSIGLSEFRSLHQVQWNLTMAATLLVMAPVIVLFFLAQARVRRRRHPRRESRDETRRHRRGLDVHAELVLRLTRLPVDEFALHDVDAEPARRRRRAAAAHARAPELRRRDVRTADLDRAIDGADFVLFQIRVGGQAARLRDETMSPCVGASARRRPAPAASRRRCARFRCARHRGAGRRARGARRLDRRLHESRRHRHAARCSTPATGRRPVQCRHRLPARDRRHARRRPRAASPSTRSASTT